jgi:hypothetical protein
MSEKMFCEVAQVDVVDIKSAVMELEKISLYLPAIQVLKPTDLTHLAGVPECSLELDQAIEAAKGLAREISHLETIDKYLYNPMLVLYLSSRKPLYIEYMVYLACIMSYIDQDLVEHQRGALGRWYCHLLPLTRDQENHIKVKQSFASFQKVLNRKLVEEIPMTPVDLALLPKMPIISLGKAIALILWTAYCSLYIESMTVDVGNVVVFKARLKLEYLSAFIKRKYDATVGTTVNVGRTIRLEAQRFYTSKARVKEILLWIGVLLLFLYLWPSQGLLPEALRILYYHLPLPLKGLLRLS